MLKAFISPLFIPKVLNLVFENFSFNFTKFESSALIKAVPPSFRHSNISLFALVIFSTDPSFSICESPILVIMAISGSTILKMCYFTNPLSSISTTPN